jgi:hypothetical protein
MVIGQVSSGKSSFINSLFGRRLFIPSDQPTDGVVSILQAVGPGEPERAEKVRRDGVVEPFANLPQAMAFLRQQETASDAQLQCQEVRVYLDEPWLRQLRIVNTPGLGDRLEAFQKATLNYLQEDESDLVIWTFFPDTAANQMEVGIFSDALARRRGAVLGVVTRCLEGREDDLAFDPRQDPSLADVGHWLRQTLGRFLGGIVFYDSHAARRLLESLRKQPDLQADPAFTTRLERTGYPQVHQALAGLLGPDRERVLEAKALSLRQRCRAHALGLASVAEAANGAFLRAAHASREEIEAWTKVEREIIGPAQTVITDLLRTLAQERARELCTIMGTCASDAIHENFGLATTLMRSAASWSGICDSAADALNGAISREVEAGIGRANFYSRLNQAMEATLLRQLQLLQFDMARLVELGDARPSSADIAPDVGRPAGAGDNVLGDALATALKPVVAAILKALAKKIEEKMAAAAIKAAAEKVVEAAATTAAETAAKKAAQEGVSAGLARAAGVITLVLIPPDIAKMNKDFAKGREHLADSVKARYLADRHLYELRILDALTPIAGDAMALVLKAARAQLGATNGVRTRNLELAQRADSLRKGLLELAGRFKDDAHA